MIKIRHQEERGRNKLDWLDSFHSFSFGRYHDPDQMGFHSLRVINEDRVAPGKGFGTHAHKDMEIVSYVLSGALEHKDSMGNGETLRPGQFQRISAGSGIEHSEFNPSADEETHFYQIWLLPHTAGLTPGYEQKEFALEERTNKWRIVASPDGANGSLSIQQNAKLFLSTIDTAQEVSYELELNRHAWIQVLRGDLEIDGIPITAGDGAAIEGIRAFSLTAKTDAECMLFDLS